MRADREWIFRDDIRIQHEEAVAGQVVLRKRNRSGSSERDRFDGRDDRHCRMARLVLFDVQLEVDLELGESEDDLRHARFRESIEHVLDHRAVAELDEWLRMADRERPQPRPESPDKHKRSERKVV
jgi:hypothetical protein